VDLKTGATAPRDEELDRYPQLGVYQLAVLLGAFAELGLAEPGGAELVHIGTASGAGRASVQRQRALTGDPDPTWAHALVKEVAAGMAGPRFAAAVNEGCRMCPASACCPVDPRGRQVAP